MKKNNKTYIIAEAGVNHNGDIALAKQLIDVAKYAGADAVKFQTFKASNLASSQAKKAPYQNKTTSEEQSQLEMLKTFELTFKQHIELLSYCNQQSIQFLSTPFDLESIDLLAQLNLPIYKIPSGEITHVPYLRKIATLEKPIILSTGMSNLNEVEKAIDIMFEAGLSQNHLSLLHCTSEYPCPFQDVNLNAILTIKEACKLPVGYSDHTPGISVSLAAVALGATIIEKHITLDKNLPGPDHKSSLAPEELNNLVKEIRHVESALGNGIKEPAPSEIKNIPFGRKSIYANKNIQKGETFTDENLICKRPENGIPSHEWDNIIGTVSKKDYDIDEKI